VQRTHLTYLIVGLCACAAISVIWLATGAPSRPVDEGLARDTDNSVVTDTIEADRAANSPFATRQPSDTPSISPGAQGNLISSSSAVVDLSGVDTPTVSAKSAATIDVTMLGRSSMSDEAFELLVERLRNDPVLLQQLVDEFRQETDPERQMQLLSLLGEAGGSTVTLAASELIYSGNPKSRRLGLELLQMVQPDNAEARNIASSLLSTEVEPDILVSTLTTLANPADVDSESRKFLSEQVAILATHADASVRSISLDILSRWSTSSQFTELLVNGLSDSAGAVRESAAYSLVGRKDPGESVITALYTVAMDPAENRRVRRGSILALRGMPITAGQRDSLVTAERELDTEKR